MTQHFYRDLAAAGLRMPVATDLILHEQPDPEQVMEDGLRLGQVMESAARRFHTPLALSPMDLRLEKRDLLRLLGHSDVDSDSYVFPTPPSEDQLARARDASSMSFAKRHQAHQNAIRYVAGRTDLVPVGMAIGPFSLMTRPAWELRLKTSPRSCRSTGRSSLRKSPSRARSPRQIQAGSDIFERFVLQPNL